jgi:methyl-accepting chemotaxis protein
MQAGQEHVENSVNRIGVTSQAADSMARITDEVDSSINEAASLVMATGAVVEEVSAATEEVTA